MTVVSGKTFRGGGDRVQEPNLTASFLVVCSSLTVMADEMSTEGPNHDMS